MAKQKRNEEWERMAGALAAAGGRCMFQLLATGAGGTDVECWLVAGELAIFTPYYHGGFEVYTINPECPRETDKIIPWLESRSK